MRYLSDKPNEAEYTTDHEKHDACVLIIQTSSCLPEPKTLLLLDLFVFLLRWWQSQSPRTQALQELTIAYKK